MPDIRDNYQFSSKDVAFYLIAKANEEKLGINVTKVQKLLYIIYGTYLRLYGERLLDEHPKAWPYGPVFPSTRKAILKRMENEEFSFPINDVDESLKRDERLNKVISLTLDHFGYWSSGQLTLWSHQAGAPWDKTTKLPGFKWGDTISDELIYDYFQKLVMVNDQQ